MVATAPAQEERKPFFESAADDTLAKVKATYHIRGSEYVDSWALDNIHDTFTKTAIREIADSPHYDFYHPLSIRLLQCAAIIDIKESRMAGPYKEDTLIDGIAYRAVFIECLYALLDEPKSPKAESDEQNDPDYIEFMAWKERREQRRKTAQRAALKRERNKRKAVKSRKKKSRR